MEFRPCIDLHDGKVKQIVGSTLGYTDQTVVENFISSHDASYYAQMFAHDQLTGGHVIMLGPGNEKAALAALAAYPQGLQIGGGITTDNAQQYIDAGASHVIVTSFIFHDGQLNIARLKQLQQLIGKEHLVIDLSCKMRDGKWFVMTDKWTKFSNFEVNAESIAYIESFCDELLIHAVDVEGKKGGMQESLVRDLAAWTSIPTTYAGGVRSLEDLAKFNDLANGRLHVTIGSALSIFGGDLPYTDVVKYCKEGGIL
ncbi:phosphoribosylformimino-5-aminoimidazole carboxamide ribotide isomerase [Lysinibacillus macroides]|uniref:Phosphoribosylformimino-5-aminoimidazole carboxamide ribotide isomerase n=1 Tax=Lysinibacillus macroides TaxID=33935 RepID=A0A0N0UWC2_9BACI|nr:phosphoribosylformimino-5-aminoimidazole carboxamide ribotide isomerase [Lysinibacillus macroides]KOY81011.1 phosphoribosylformimino-5-aminoimidazole carboxamide ribotide isomerase [Lysinibacillus macroides]QPR68841.1 phosphoribosylformimino-5-aminoimidazole carboxamide ribotide isomerase [Lysinibacillus macroides]